MNLTNKEEFITDTKLYKMLTDLEQAVRDGDDFAVSIMLTKLKQRKITFEVSFEEIDQESQC